jgi:hypothetical protein
MIDPVWHGLPLTSTAPDLIKMEMSDRDVLNSIPMKCVKRLSKMKNK